ncbi:hypothetical protein AAG570_002801 [Ranatra chinensis]|uniref:Ig-like domain-containing protein n=1 Tax=Ranatra chinensis TaxID=642074 RepID=A0ABD0Y4Y7_9HEMI
MIIGRGFAAQNKKLDDQQRLKNTLAVATFPNRGLTVTNPPTRRFNETYINVYHNGTHMVKWSPKNKLILYYFTIDSTKPVLWTANIPPPYLVGTPINGEWSEWIAIRCSVSCGGGTGIRLRTCTNPSPSLEGRPCLGPDMEKSRCNVRRCGTLSESSREYFKDGLRHSISYRVLKGEPLELGVEQHAVDRLRAEMPDAHIRWARNGLNLTPLKPLNTSLPEDYYLNISSASYNDSGTYICMVLSPLQEVTVIHIYAVSVYSLEPSLELSIGSEFSPECKSLYLLYFFNKLYHHWVLNQSKDVVELPIEKFHSESKFTIKVTKEHSGIWECVVKSDRLNITWVTNWIYLEEFARDHYPYGWYPFSISNLRPLGGLRVGRVGG